MSIRKDDNESDLNNSDFDPNDDIDDVPPEFLCPLTYSIMKDPVLMPDGQTYEREAIQRALSKNPISPVTRQPMDISEAMTNYALKNLIEKYILNHQQQNSKNESTLTKPTKSNQTPPAIQNPNVSQLKSMGFDEQSSISALEESNNDIERAIDILLNQNKKYKRNSNKKTENKSYSNQLPPPPSSTNQRKGSSPFDRKLKNENKKQKTFKNPYNPYSTGFYDEMNDNNNDIFHDDINYNDQSYYTRQTNINNNYNNNLYYNDDQFYNNDNNPYNNNNKKYDNQNFYSTNDDNQSFHKNKKKYRHHHNDDVDVNQFYSSEKRHHKNRAYDEQKYREMKKRSHSKKKKNFLLFIILIILLMLLLLFIFSSEHIFE